MKKLILTFFLVPAIINAINKDYHEYEMPNQTYKVLALNPVIKQFNPDGSSHYGLDWKSLSQVYPELAIYDEQGNVISVNNVALIPIIIAQIQQLQIDNQNQKSLIQEQNRKIEELSLELQKN